MSSPLKTTLAVTLLPRAKIIPRRSADRGQAHHGGWLESQHTFSFASYRDSSFRGFGAIRVLNEDRVAPSSGFPTHAHRDAEIFSYVLSGELTHRDSMMGSGATAESGGKKNQKKEDFVRVRRGDVQFTTGGTGIAHSEYNDDAHVPVHFLQIWAEPWKHGLRPRYHSLKFSDTAKCAGFVTILSPLRAGIRATTAEEEAAVPTTPGTIPVHADLLMGAAIVPSGKAFGWKIGGEQAVRERVGRKIYVHLPMTGGGKARVRLAGREGIILEEGDGAFVSDVDAEDELAVESVGEVEAEVVVLDSN